MNDRYQSVTDLSGDLKRLKEEGEGKTDPAEAPSRFVALLLALAAIAVLSCLPPPEQGGSGSLQPNNRPLTFAWPLFNARQVRPRPARRDYSAGFDASRRVVTPARVLISFRSDSECRYQIRIF